ncbi:MAG: hypothetical protein JWQ49_4569 [Edaphobacter sp.]|nr:hypothetical protein [Edaphobacter sp.]
MPKALQGAALIAGAVILDAAALALGGPLAAAWVTQLEVSLLAGGISMEAATIASALTSNRGMNITTRQAAANRQIIYGQQRVGGVTIFKSTTGSHKDQLNYLIVVAGHVCDSIVNIYLDGRQVHFAGGVGNITRNGINFGGAANGNSYTGPNGVQYNFGGQVYCEARFGDQTEGQNTTTQIMGSLRANDPTWDYDTNGNSPWVAGCTYIYLKVENNPSLFPGEPEVRITVNGKNDIWDPRTQTSKFTTNWALIAADIITDTQFGLGDNTVNQLNLISAANVCDESVAFAGAGGGTESRYTCNYHYDTSMAPGDALSAIMPGAKGSYSQIGGQHYLWPDYWHGPSFSFGEQHLTSTFQWKPYRSVPDLINRVNGTYIAPTFPYNVAGNLYDRNGFYNGQAQNNFSFAFQPTNFPQYAQDIAHGYPSDQWLTADGGHQHPLELSLQSVLSIGQAQRLAKLNLMHNRFQGEGTLEMGLYGYVMQPKDIFQFTFPPLGWTNKLLEVVSSSLSVVDDPNGGAPSIRVTYSVRETDPSVYTWSTAEELTVYAVPALPSQTPLTPAPPTNMVLTSGVATAIVQPDGSLESVIQIGFNTPLDNLAVQVQVQYQLVGASTWLSAPAIDISLNLGLISGVIAGQSYNVQIRTTRASGVSSAWVQQLNYTVSTTPSFLGTLGAQIPTITANSQLGGTVPGEMIVNANFANGLTGWTTVGVVAVDASQHKLGTQSARSQGGGVSQTVALVAGHTYLYQGWVMTDGSVVAGGSLGAGLGFTDPGSHITIQRVNGTAANLGNQNPAALLPATGATAWTLLQMTLIVAVSGTYQVGTVDNYGSSAVNAHAWFDGLSLTDTTGGADITAAQPIVYTGSSESIVPNGNFILGNTQGWQIGGFTYQPNGGAQRIFSPANIGSAFSPSFGVVPGQKYRVTFLLYNGSGSGGVYLRIAYSATYLSVVQPIGGNVNNFTDLMANGSVTFTPTVYSYDWVCPTGQNYASIAVYAAGGSDLACQYVTCTPYGATGQWGADVTHQNTSADTSAVDGVPSSTIASVIPNGYKLYINNGSRSYSIQAV